MLGGSNGGPRDVVLLNAAAALWVAGTVPSLREGVELARASIDSRRAARVLDNMVTVTNGLVEERR